MKKETIWIRDEEDREFNIGDIVEHFKHDDNMDDENNYRYEIIAFAEHTEEKCELVIYRALYGDCKTYARPKEMFISEVDRAKYPNAKTKYRLTKLIKVEIY
jgi:hypothetical protein